jgi:hypothetical protein
LAKAALLSRFGNFTLEGLKQSRKLELYSTVKLNFGRERYLERIKNVDFRKAITKVRRSAHNFDIEVGRKLNIQRNLRVCSFCNTGLVGDECHVLLQCLNNKLCHIRETAFIEIAEVLPIFTNLPDK